MQTLLVDDDVEMRLLLGEVLRARGHEVLACADAETAWAAYQEEAYPLALLDLSLPGMDGLQLCRQMRTLPHGDGSIILVITGRDQSEDLEAVLEAGANDYLAKPVDISLLDVRLTIAEQQVHMLTERKRAEAALARAYEREVEIGARVQQTLLQGQPPHHLPWIRIATLTLPSQRIDGDFYDFFVYHDRCLDVMVGDVMGKGVPAALLGAATKSQFLHALCHLIAAPDRVRRPSPADIVSAVHADTTQQLINLESFITLCYAQFDLEKRQVDFVNCGHPKTIHFRPRIGRCEPLQVDNMPLGFSEHEVYKQISVPFEVGDTFVFYSDGVTESRDETGEFFGEDRLMACIQAHGKGGPQALIDGIRTTLHAFTNTTVVADDVTCIAVQIEALETSRPIEHLVFETSSELTQLSRMRAFVRQVCQDLPPPALDEDSISQLELAVNEAASNIMIHAYNGRTDQPIQLEADVFTDRIAFRLYHWGGTFDPDSVASPTFNGFQEHGFGLYIITQCVDEVQYTDDEDGRHGVYLIKRRQSTLVEETVLETTIEQVDDVTVVILPGEHLDGSNSNQFKCHIVPVLGAHRKLLFDMSQLRFVDSSGLGAILSCLRQVNAAGGELKLCGMLKPVRSLFELVRMNRIVDIIDTKAEALQSFQHE